MAAARDSGEVPVPIGRGRGRGRGRLPMAAVMPPFEPSPFTSAYHVTPPPDKPPSWCFDDKPAAVEEQENPADPSATPLITVTKGKGKASVTVEKYDEYEIVTNVSEGGHEDIVCRPRTDGAEVEANKSEGGSTSVKKSEGDKVPSIQQLLNILRPRSQNQLDQDAGNLSEEEVTLKQLSKLKYGRRKLPPTKVVADAGEATGGEPTAKNRKDEVAAGNNAEVSVAKTNDDPTANNEAAATGAKTDIVVARSSKILGLLTFPVSSDRLRTEEQQEEDARKLSEEEEKRRKKFQEMYGRVPQESADPDDDASIAPELSLD